MDSNKNNIKFLYTNIGRGHPFYLDGIIDEIDRNDEYKYIYQRSDVFDHSRGLSLLGWNLVKWLYKKGSQTGAVSALYKKIRSNNDYNNGGLLLNLLGKYISLKYKDSSYPLVVAHPILTAILKGRKNLYYQHGEMITPTEAAVKGAEKVFVPSKEAALPFYDAGYSKENVIITGLCIEPALVKQAETAFKSRTKRISDSNQLTGGFFSSGAEPKMHIDKILKAVKSIIKRDGKAIIITSINGDLYNYVRDILDENKLDFCSIDTSKNIPDELPQILLAGFKSRKEENIYTARLFNCFDYFVAPSHERSNWALGLGLPMFILEPAIGPFSPLNRAKLLEQKVAYSLKTEEANKFGAIIEEFKNNGVLSSMSHNGWGKYDINGFEKIANFFNNYFY